MNRIGPQNTADLKELNDVEATLASFIFRNEGLRLVKPFGNFVLSQLGVFSRSDQKAAEGRLLVTVD